MSWSGGPWVVDTSAWLRASAPDVAPSWAAAAAAGELIACPPVTLELLIAAPNRESVEQVAAATSALDQEAPINRTVTAAATWAIRELAARRPAGGHRVRMADTLVAAAAAERGFGVLHYDHHFDRLADVLRFRSQWVAPAGSLD